MIWMTNYEDVRLPSFVNQGFRPVDLDVNLSCFAPEAKEKLEKERKTMWLVATPHIHNDHSLRC